MISGFYRHQLQSLLSGYDPTKPTVILLPGGMGSQLERSAHPVDHEPNIIDDIIWLDLGILPPKSDARKLRIERVGRHAQDLGRHVVAAHGPLKFMTQTPYEELKDLAQRSRWNYFVFGYDWRRSLRESATFFKAFLREFRNEVRSTHGIDPIPSLTIICHSMGGLVCTSALRDPQFCALGFANIVTVGTPFYGTSTQQERYYSGDGGTLNSIYGAQAVASITATLPGPYTLMLLPHAIYLRDGASLGLSEYPQRDANSNAPADPYDASMRRRWPRYVQDEFGNINHARTELSQLAEPIDARIRNAFYNVRSSLDIRTAVGLKWADIDGDRFVPGTTPSPITGIAGPGDGTVPAWSAWHAYCQPSHRYELKYARDHGALLEHEEVLVLIESLVSAAKLPSTRKRATAQPVTASTRKVKLAIEARKQTILDRGIFDRSVQRAIVTSFISGKKPRMIVKRKSHR